MLINGQRQWMLVKNVPIERGYEIDALDMPVLNLKLVLELLRAAAPGGPGQLKEKTTFDVKEEGADPVDRGEHRICKWRT
jgi:hypothetical protein